MIEFTYHNGTFRIGNKMVGRLEMVHRHTVYVSHRVKEQHLMRKSDSWCIDRKILEWLKERNIPILVIDETNRRYFTGPLEFLAKGIPQHYEGHGPQICLNRGYWIGLMQQTL